MKMVITVLILLAPVFAQNIYPEVGVHFGCGASYFPVTLSGGTELSTDRALVLIKGDYNPGGKTDVGGHAWTSLNSVLWRLPKGLLTGVGANITETVTPTWTKGPFFYPQILGGFERGAWRVIGHYTFSGTDATNEVHGPGGTLRGYYNKRLAVDFTLGYYRAHASYAANVSQSSLRYSVGIFYLFRGVHERR